MDSDIENNAYTSILKRSFNHRKQIIHKLIFHTNISAQYLQV